MGSTETCSASLVQEEEEEESVKLSSYQLPFNNTAEDQCLYSQKDAQNAGAPTRTDGFFPFMHEKDVTFF